MKYRQIVFDIDNTLIHTEYAVLHSLQEVLKEEKGKETELSELGFALGIPGADVLKRLGIQTVEKTLAAWELKMEEYQNTSYVFEGIVPLLENLKAAGYFLGIITSKTSKQYSADCNFQKLEKYFKTVVCADDTKGHKPDPEPLLKYLEITGAAPKEVLYIGDSSYDMLCAKAAGVDCGLAVWGCRSFVHIHADYYFSQPYEVWNAFVQTEDPYAGKGWLKRAMELQFIAQAGLTYSKDIFDRERFERVRQIAAELVSENTSLPLGKVTELFCGETGYQTPKLDTRAAVFEEGKILLVKEKSGGWSLPGGWVDADQSIKTNTVKEVKEEAGLEVVPVRLIALHDRNRHNFPVYAYAICKVFVLCELIGGSFAPNSETTESGFFTANALPDLAQEKNTLEQVLMCFEAYKNKNWIPVFD